MEQKSQFSKQIQCRSQLSTSHYWLYRPQIWVQLTVECLDLDLSSERLIYLHFPLLQNHAVKLGTLKTDYMKRHIFLFNGASPISLFRTEFLWLTKTIFYFQTAVNTAEIILSRRRNGLDLRNIIYFYYFQNPYWSNKTPGLKHIYKCTHLSKLFYNPWWAKALRKP